MSGPYFPYAGRDKMNIGDRAAQIRGLSAIGLAASGSIFNIKNPDSAFVSLFEVIARLADEIEDEVAE